MAAPPIAEEPTANAGEGRIHPEAAMDSGGPGVLKLGGLPSI